MWLAVCAVPACSKVKTAEPESDPRSIASMPAMPKSDAARAARSAVDETDRSTAHVSDGAPPGIPTAPESESATPASEPSVDEAPAPAEPELTAGSGAQEQAEPLAPNEADVDAAPREPPDLSCAGFGNTTGGLAACGSLQPWLAPTLGHEGFAINLVSWLPLHSSDGWIALVTIKREVALPTETYISAYRFDEQGACLQHIGTIENALAFYPVQPRSGAVRGGTAAVLVASYGRRGTLAGLTVLANGKVLRNVQGDARMDVTPQGEIVLAQTPWQESVGYTLELTVLDAGGATLREAARPSPGLIADLDASEAGQLVVLYKAALDENGGSQPSRRVDRYDAELALQDSWLAPEDVDLSALDVEGSRVAVVGQVWGTADTVWTQLLQLPGWNPVWAVPAQSPGLERAFDVDLTVDGRVLLVGSTTGSDTFDWLTGYGADGVPLWNEAWKRSPASSSTIVSAQQNGHILIPGPFGYCAPTE